MPLRRALLLLVLGPALPALASGLGIPDLGAASIGQGNATVARPQDLSALYYNPAGLASLDGIQVMADFRAVKHDVLFQRLEADGSNPNHFAPVQNSGTPRVAPIIGVSWRTQALGMPFSLALGGVPSNGNTGYTYPDPADLRARSLSDVDIARLTPQRYTSIESNSKIWTPSLSAAARVLPWLDVGASAQFSVAYFSTRQAISAAPIQAELVGFDAVLDLEAQDWFRPSALVGASAALPGDLYFGAAFQLPTHYRASGTIKATLPTAASSLGAALHGDRIEATVNFPWVLRAGLRLSKPAFDVELAGTLDGWSQLQQIRIHPIGVEIELAGTKQALPDIVIQKDLKNAWSIRLGGEWRPAKSFAWLSPFGWLTLRAGALAESSAVPEDRQALDMVHWQRWSLSAGASAHLGRYDLALGYSHFFQPVRQVRDSQVMQVTALPSIAPDVVGNGDFSSQIDMVALSTTVKF
jgi:long-chain fatty acid transport protein